MRRGTEITCLQCKTSVRLDRQATSDEPGGALPYGWFLARRSNWVSLGDFCSAACLARCMIGIEVSTEADQATSDPLSDAAIERVLRKYGVIR